MEDNETFRLIISSSHLPAGVTAGSLSLAQATIEDDEPDPTLSVSVSPASGAEGDSGHAHARVDVTLSPANSALTPFLLCVKSTGTATLRTTHGSDAADFDLVLETSATTGLTVISAQRS